MKVRSVLLAATILALPLAVKAAEPVSGVYVGAGLGFDYLNSMNGKSLVVPSRDTPGVSVTGGDWKSNGGFVGLGSIGYGLGNGLRLEVEGNFRENHVHNNNTSMGGGGDFQQYGVMVNGLYDFTTLAPWVSPYVGIGVGYIENSVQNGVLYTPYSGTPSLQGRVALNNSAKGSAAGQFILGAAFPVLTPGLAITTEFRFMGEFSQQSYGGRAYLVTASGAQSGSVYGTTLKMAAPTNESFLIGLRYAFNAAPAPMPAPAPVAAPAPAPARTYLVFFDWDKADLTARAHQIIAEAAQNSTRVQVTKIEVDGYADRTGTAQYNMVLSRKRADNVAADLVKLGVPKNIISIQAFGDTHLLVPTAQGVREPQNRRVEIILK